MLSGVTMNQSADSTIGLANINSDIDAVKFIEQRREMLRRILNLMNAVQRLTSSLELLLVSSGTNTKIADKTFGLLDYLDDKQRHLTSSKIEIRLDALDHRVRDQLSEILSSLDDEGKSSVALAEGSDDIQDPLDVVSEFRRKVRLSMAYRLLLVERGSEINPIELDVAPELISNTVRQLEYKEAFYKGKLIDDMQTFEQEVTQMLRNKSLSEKVRLLLKNAAVQLKQGVIFIKQNKSIDILPDVLDVAEFSEIKDDEGNDIIHEEPVVEDTEVGDRDSMQGFFGTLNTWLSAPKHVSWKEAKRLKK